MDMINQGFDVVVDILKKIGYNQCKEPIVQKGRTIGAINHAVMPLLIKQTLFYLCYVGQCKDAKKIGICLSIQLTFLIFQGFQSLES